jgi:hypothetical protein
MNCKECNPIHLVYEDGSAVCTECGRVHTHLQEYVVGINTYNDPLQICFYQRRKRFLHILEKITAPYMDNKDVSIYKLLLDMDTTFDTVEDIMATLKKLPVKDKRYHSLHIFSKLFLKDYVMPSVLSERSKKRCMFLFSEIESAFLKCKTVPFFNYAWLIRRVLNHFKFYEYDAYIKRIKCEKRNAYYNEMFNELYTTIQAQADVGNYP